MQWIEEQWQNCPSDIIANSFTHCIKQRISNSDIIEKDVVNEMIHTMKRDAAEAGVQLTYAGLNDLIYPADEDNVVEEIRKEEVVWDIAGLEKGSEDDIEVDGDAEDDNEEDCSVKDLLRFLANTKMTLERHGLLKSEISNAFSKEQRDLRLERQDKLRQTFISDFQ